MTQISHTGLLSCLLFAFDVHKQQFQRTYHCLPSKRDQHPEIADCLGVFLTQLIKGDACVYNCVIIYCFIFLLVETVTTKGGVWQWERHHPHSHGHFHLSHLQLVLFFTPLCYTTNVYLTSSSVLLRFTVYFLLLFFFTVRRAVDF